VSTVLKRPAVGTVVALVATLTLVAACSGDSEGTDDSSATTTSATTEIAPAPTTTPAATTTTEPEPTTTTTTLPPGLLPVPADVPLPPVDSLQNVAVTLTPMADIPLALGMAWSEIDQSFFIITQPGEVYRATRDFASTELVLDLTAEVSPFIYGSERGMLGVAVNPLDGRLFVNFTDLDYNSNVVSFAVVDGRPDPATRRNVLFVEQPGVSHKAGMLFFDDEGALFISFGDGGNNKGRTSQDYTSLLGGILKIVPDPDGDGYSIPEDNPFAGDPFIRPEIYAKGLRQPHRFAYNRANGDIYIGDVGENAFEELNYLPAGTKGVNFGWYFMEGFNKRMSGGEFEFTAPIYQFAHPSWVAIIVGYVYHGEAVPALRGSLLFGDMTGKISALGSDGIAPLPISETGNILTSFAEGPDGEIYTLSLDEGVKRIDPA
jgi:glucose/arabinose dehydrogenase